MSGKIGCRPVSTSLMTYPGLILVIGIHLTHIPHLVEGMIPFTIVAIARGCFVACYDHRIGPIMPPIDLPPVFCTRLTHVANVDDF